MKGEELKLPDFLDIVKEVTVDRSYSMFNLSCKNSSVGEKKEPTNGTSQNAIAPTELSAKPGQSEAGIVSNGTHV